jgi:hypothetical protein
MAAVERGWSESRRTPSKSGKIKRHKFISEIHVHVPKVYNFSGKTLAIAGPLRVLEIE